MDHHNQNNVEARFGNAQFMKPMNEAISTCRHCQFYRSEGRRGGCCERLGVPVQGSWKACCLAIAPFTSTWEKLARITPWQTPGVQPSVIAELPMQTATLVEPVLAGVSEELLLNID